jgi:regulator of protease activity HflC (stomatin/prohibitin superfamily)
MEGLIVVGVLALFVLLLAAKTVRIIPQARAGVVERLGRYQRTLEPGLAIVIPFVDRVKPLNDLREQVVSFRPQSVITKDNVTVNIDTVLYFTITDAASVTYEVANPLQAIEQLTVTTLRNVIGSLTLEETLTSRDQINMQLRAVLDEATGRWGIRVNRVELKSVDPPATIQEAMEKQMRAERDRRARSSRRGRQAVADPHRRGREAVGRPAGRGRQDGGHPARRGRVAGDRDGLPRDPRGPARPGAAQLPVPPDAPRAGQGRGEQGVRHPVRVLSGLAASPRGSWRRGRRPPRRPPARGPARGGAARARRRLRQRRDLDSSAVFDALSEKLQQTLSDVRQRGHADRGRRQRDDARDPPRAARGRRQLQGRPRVHQRPEGARARRGGHRGAEPGPDRRQDRQRRAARPHGRRRRRHLVLAAPPTVILMAGLQGSGKTTATAKLAKLLKEHNGSSVAVAACDVYRPAAVDQLVKVGGQAGAEVYEQGTDKDPVDIARWALDRAKMDGKDVLIVDTAGRLHVDERLMQELKDIRRRSGRT